MKRETMSSLRSRPLLVFAALAAVLMLPVTGSAEKEGLPNGKPFVELNGQIVEVKNTLAELNNRIAAVETSVATLPDRVAALEGFRSELQAEIADLKSQLEQLDPAVAENQEQIQDLLFRMDQNEQAVTMVDTRTEELADYLALLSSALNQTCEEGEVVVGVADNTVVCAPPAGVTLPDHTHILYEETGINYNAVPAEACEMYRQQEPVCGPFGCYCWVSGQHSPPPVALCQTVQPYCRGSAEVEVSCVSGGEAVEGEVICDPSASCTTTSSGRTASGGWRFTVERDDGPPFRYYEISVWGSWFWVFDDYTDVRSQKVDLVHTLKCKGMTIP